jgi:signal recognition particle GTPase
MGTLVFHILLFSVFLLSDVEMKGNVKEEAIVIEFPDLPPEPEIIEEENTEEQEDQIDNSNKQINNRRNLASNRTATENTTKSADDFFDDEYLKELEAAQKLSSDVSNNLSKEIVDMSDIEMPVESTEGMNPDSIKNVIYTGESNIVYYLENRHHLRIANPVYLSHGGGTVVVDITVNRSGKVTEAIAQKNRKIRDKQILLYAQEAALRTYFNADNTAPAAQKGTIHYTFVAQ